MTTLDSVPVIDASKLPGASALRAIDHACRDWGFFQVVNHGIDGEAILALQREMRAFFDLPLDVKRLVERSADNPWGFYDRELTKNTRDWKQIFDCGPEDDPALRTPWPAGSPEFRPALRGFAHACEGLAFRLLAAISLNLGMPAHHLAGGFRPLHTSFLRLNYYPVCPEPALPTSVQTPDRGHLGVNHHTDAGALTLLLQDDVPGLEVHREGRWHLVEPRSDALVINIGDIVQVWSNDRYRAALHRVRASADRVRYSAPFFFNPAYDTRYAPLPTTCGAGSPARYRPIRWGEFRSLRAAGDYRDCGEEVQIDHYRIENTGAGTSPPEEASHGIH
ncbi:MAG TPA: 2OG-Fe(II) oxygenase family protein [Myxococcota bacterium]